MGPREAGRIDAGHAPQGREGRRTRDLPKAYHRFDRGPAFGMASGRTREGFTYRLDEKARQDAWNRTLAWFRSTSLPSPNTRHRDCRLHPRNMH